MSNTHLESQLHHFELQISDFSTSDKLKALSMLQTQIESIDEPIDLAAFEENIRQQFSIPKKKKEKKKMSFLRWLLLVFFGSQVLFIIGIIILAIKFTPIIKVDEEKNHVTLLGGLIDINGQSGRIKIFDQYQFVENTFSNEFIGDFELTSDIDEVLLNFSEGIYRFRNSKDQKVYWSCKLESLPTDEIVQFETGTLSLNLKKYQGSCDIEIPLDSKLTISGKNGQVILDKPQYDLFTELENGTIKMITNRGIGYKFDVTVDNGISRQDLRSSSDPNAYEINIQLENGSFFIEE